MKRLRWKIADWLSFLACKLRGHEWYCQGYCELIGGNRAADLTQSIWERCILLDFHKSEPTDNECLDELNRELKELGQLAGENWWHS